MKTIVTINTFKSGGKWYTDYTYESDIPCYEGQKLIEEAKHKCLLNNIDFTIHAKQGDAVNFRLVKA